MYVEIFCQIHGAGEMTRDPEEGAKEIARIRVGNDEERLVS